MLAGLHGLGGEIEVRLAGCGDDDEIDGGVAKGFVGGAENVRGGIGACGFVAFALDDRSQFKAGNGGDEGAVEDFTSEAEAEDSAANGGFGRGAHAPIVRCPDYLTV